MATTAEEVTKRNYRKMLKQLGASAFFGIVSVLIVMINKTVLTVHKLVNCIYILINAH